MQSESLIILHLLLDQIKYRGDTVLRVSSLLPMIAHCPLRLSKSGPAICLLPPDRPISLAQRGGSQGSHCYQVSTWIFQHLSGWVQLINELQSDNISAGSWAYPRRPRWPWATSASTSRPWPSASPTCRPDSSSPSSGASFIHSCSQTHEIAVLWLREQ